MMAVEIAINFLETKYCITTKTTVHIYYICNFQIVITYVNYYMFMFIHFQTFIMHIKKNKVCDHILVSDKTGFKSNSL